MSKNPSPTPPHKGEGLNPAALTFTRQTLRSWHTLLIWTECLTRGAPPPCGEGTFSLIRTHAKSPARKIRRRASVMVRSGGPHAGFASGIASKKGGAARARPEFCRMMSASNRRCLAAHGAGYLTCPSSGPSARVATAAAWTDRGCGFRGSGTDPDRHIDASQSAPKPRGDEMHPADHVRHRPVPVLHPGLPSGSYGAKSRPGGWLCTAPSEEFLPENGRPPAETPMATASPHVLPHVTSRQRGLPPAWSDTFAGPSGSGSAMMMT